MARVLLARTDWMSVTLGTVLAVLLIVLTLRDLVDELFHPATHGSISRAISRAIWWLARLLGRRWRGALLHAGPSIMLSVLVSWTALLAVGWALLYWPRLTTGYHVESSLPLRAVSGFRAALYVSLSTMTNLGAPDFAPRDDTLRFFTMIEALVGPVLITSWITWVLSIYPVLAERRVFAREVALLRRAEPSATVAIGHLSPIVLAEALRSLADKLLRIHASLEQSRVTYYFQNQPEDSSIAGQLPWVLELGREAVRIGADETVCHHGRFLCSALDGLAADIGKQFLSLEGATTDELLRAIREDHMVSWR
jgi:hypothetical protein